MDNYTGKRLDGRYEIQEVIGVGGMAVVYKAYDNIDDRTVAVKILKDEYLANEEFRRRFKNESKAIAVLSHPNIVKVFNVNYGDRLQYIVMEYVEGITLKEYIEQQGKLGVKETVYFTTQILRALQHAHDKGIVHRDIKPQNILLLSNGNIKVTDFGIARFSYSDTKTMTDGAIGSVHYISPEQARGDATDERADIYSVGVVMYEMLTGRLPFESDNSVSVALMQLQEDPKRPRDINKDIPAGLEQIVIRAMQKNAKDRYQSAAEMLLDLEEFKRNPSVRFQESYFVDTDPTKHVNKSTPQSTPQPEYEYVDDDDDEPRGKGSFIAAGIIIGLLLVGLVVLGSLYFFTDVFKAQVATVPTFVGKIYETEVQNAVEYKDIFIFDPEPIANSSYPDGMIFDQYPRSGSKLTKETGNVIKLSVAKNDRKVNVTDVYGMQIQLATDTLESQGFKVNAMPALSVSEEFGTVIKTEPERNTEAEGGQTIIVYYASDEDLVTVPNVIGMNTTMAQAIIESVNLVYDTEVKKQNSTKAAGVVIEQTPNPDEKAFPNTKVSIVVSNGIPPQTSASVTFKLPSGGDTGICKVWVNSELYTTKTLRMSGDNYTLEIEGSGSGVPVTVEIDGREHFTCHINFKNDPPIVYDEDYPTHSSPTVTRASLPDVTGDTETEAKNELEDAGFTNITVDYRTVYNDNQNGIVIAQSPSPTGSGMLALSSYYSTDTEIILTVGQKDGV
ncbi:MAG: Stk1 family PASTA domain-containing Ser/Thr kinase [Clostridia bacterium]|nr:Stk1 family PASTA domain-containing Ser/Thr kinase [Clostridia bacterium]